VEKLSAVKRFPVSKNNLKKNYFGGENLKKIDEEGQSKRG